MPSKNPTMLRRRPGSIRVSASAKINVNTTSGKTSPLDAAAIAFSGTMVRKKSATAGTVPDAAPGSMAASPARNASLAPEDSGKNSSNAGINSAPKIADAVQTITNHRTDRPPIRPARAASAPCAMPVMSKATINGITDILSPLIHSPPTIAALASADSRNPSPSDRADAPAASPTISASSTQ
jgi:hypothetical protein